MNKVFRVRLTDGDFDEFTASAMLVDNGTLYLYEELLFEECGTIDAQNSKLIVVYAPGVWKTVRQVH